MMWWRILERTALLEMTWAGEHVTYAECLCDVAEHIDSNDLVLHSMWFDSIGEEEQGIAYRACLVVE